MTNIIKIVFTFLLLSFFSQHVIASTYDISSTKDTVPFYKKNVGVSIFISTGIEALCNQIYYGKNWNRAKWYIGPFIYPNRTRTLIFDSSLVFQTREFNIKGLEFRGILSGYQQYFSKRDKPVKFFLDFLALYSFDRIIIEEKKIFQHDFQALLGCGGRFKFHKMRLSFSPSVSFGLIKRYMKLKTYGNISLYDPIGFTTVIKVGIDYNFNYKKAK